MFVLDTIADDYEEIEHITERIDAWSAVCGLNVSRDEIVQALITLTQEGLARAYHLMETRGNKPEEIETILSADQIRLRDPYFLITDKGVQEVSRPDDGWPFDEEGSLRRDWVPPKD